MQPDEFADMVVLTVKAALAPLQAELAVLREKVAAADVQQLRERIVAVETKAAIPAAPDVSLEILRDRLLVLETKSTAPIVETREPVVVPDTADLRDRIVTLETRSAGPTTADMAIVDLRERLTSLERRVVDDSLTKEIGAIRERIAVVEVRAQVPGPAGKDGANGKDGADGFGFDDIDVKFDGFNMLTLEFAKGGTVKSYPFSLPFLRYQGVYQEGQKYNQGDVTTWAGSTWHCNELSTTAKPGEGSKDWQLMVKRGRDGRDGRDGHDAALPVVKVGA